MEAIADKVREIRERHAAAVPGPWHWFGNTKGHTFYLATVGGGRRYIMDFVRWGMRSAQPRFQVYPEGGAPFKEGLMEEGSKLVEYEVPYRKDFVSVKNPDARFLEHSWQDVHDLLEELDASEKALEEAGGVADEAIAAQADAESETASMEQACNEAGRAETEACQDRAIMVARADVARREFEELRGAVENEIETMRQSAFYPNILEPYHDALFAALSAGDKEGAALPLTTAPQGHVGRAAPASSVAGESRGDAIDGDRNAAARPSPEATAPSPSPEPEAGGGEGAP